MNADFFDIAWVLAIQVYHVRNRFVNIYFMRGAEIFHSRGRDVRPRIIIAQPMTHFQYNAMKGQGENAES